MEPDESGTKQNEETITMIVPKNLMKRPFPLVWGLVAMFLFVAFAAVTIYQFNQINEDKIHEAQMDSYSNAVKVYESAVKAHDDCISTIKVRDTYRSIFGGIEDMFTKTADLPVELFPDSQGALLYQQSMYDDIQDNITRPVEENLPPKQEADCPKLPEEEPERP